MLKYWLLAGVFVLTQYISFAQTHVTDSLKSLLHRTQEKDKRLHVLLLLGKEQQNLNRDTAYEYAREAMSLANGSNHRNKSLAALYFAQSYIPWGWTDSTLAILEQVLPMNPVTNTATRDLYFLLQREKAMTHGNKTQYKEALEILYRLINEAKNYKDSFSVSSNMNTIASIALARQQPAEALPWLYKALSYVKKDDTYLPVTTAIYINLANAFNLNGKNDSSLFYIQKAIPTAQKLENLFLLRHSLRVQTNILVKTRQLKDAENSFREMQKIAARTETSNVVDENLAIINFYISIQQYEKAIQFCKLNLQTQAEAQLSQKGTFTNQPSIKLVYYEALARCYKLTGNQLLYLQTLENIVLLKDSVHAEAAVKEIADIQTRYETQIKENTIIQQQRLDIVRKNYLFYILLVVFITAAIAGIMIFRNIRRRQRIKLAAALSEEKRLADEAVKQAEEKERVRIARDLHDNLGAYAASLASNLNYLKIEANNTLSLNAYRELKNNSGAIISELNDTIWALKKHNLSFTAISDRIKVFVNRLGKSYPDIHINIRENIIQDIVFPDFQAFHLYRIVQEAANNALKHSNGSLINIGMFSENNCRWMIEVSDNGSNMLLMEKLTDETSGIYNMKKRSSENGWKIEWLSATPGTTVRISST